MLKFFCRYYLFKLFYACFIRSVEIGRLKLCLDKDRNTFRLFNLQKDKLHLFYLDKDTFSIFLSM